MLLQDLVHLSRRIKKYHCNIDEVYRSESNEAYDRRIRGCFWYLFVQTKKGFLESGRLTGVVYRQRAYFYIMNLPFSSI